MAADQMQTRKRRRAEQVELQDAQPGPQAPSRLKTTKRSKPNFPAHFWDSLSEVLATSRALRELDRRNKARPAPKLPPPAVPPTDLGRFARHGGPDLRHLRGCPPPKVVMDMDRPKMTSHRRSSSSSSRHATSEPAATATTGATIPKVRQSSAYDVNFLRHLSDHGIHLPDDDYEGPMPDIDGIRLQLSARRRSLSPSRFDDAAFRDFKRVSRSVEESSTLAKVILVIAGNANIPNEHNLMFANSLTMTDGRTVNPAPDFFDGAPPGALHKSLRDDLSNLVVPTKHPNVPVAPNFFLEAKPDTGTSAVAERQASFDGAYGARAMHSLQNYRENVPTYTTEVHAYSSTYCAGTLWLYGHHVTAPTGSNRKPGYRMTAIMGKVISSSRASFVEGVTAFRNARDLAQRHRDQLIQSANAKARRANPPLFDEAPTVTGNRDAVSDGPVDRAERVASDAAADEGPADPPHTFLDGDGIHHESGADVVEPTLDFATSAAPVNGPMSPPSSERVRVSGSPPSDAQRQKKQSLA